MPGSMIDASRPSTRRLRKHLIVAWLAVFDDGDTGDLRARSSRPETGFDNSRIFSNWNGCQERAVASLGGACLLAAWSVFRSAWSGLVGPGGAL